MSENKTLLRDIYGGTRASDHLFRLGVAVAVVGGGLSIGTLCLADMATHLAGFGEAWWLWTLAAGMALLTWWLLDVVEAAENRAYEREDRERSLRVVVMAVLLARKVVLLSDAGGRVEP